MSRLAELQQTFQQCLLDPPEKLAQDWIRPGGRAQPARQLSAYVHAYATRLKEVLAIDYPALRLAIGEDAFDQLAQRYIDAHPSRHFSLREFGARLTGFLAARTDYSDLPWLVELACFEWALGRAFDAADTPPATVEDMAAIAPEDWPDLHIDLHPCVQRLELSWNSVDMWSGLTSAEPRPVTAFQAEPVTWLVWRERLTTRFRSLEPDEADALACLSAGGSFGAMCEQLAGRLEEDAVPLRAATLLKGWLVQGLIRRIGTHGPNDM